MAPMGVVRSARTIDLRGRVARRGDSGARAHAAGASRAASRLRRGQGAASSRPEELREPGIEHLRGSRRLRGTRLELPRGGVDQVSRGSKLRRGAWERSRWGGEASWAFAGASWASAEASGALTEATAEARRSSAQRQSRRWRLLTVWPSREEDVRGVHGRADTLRRRQPPSSPCGSSDTAVTRAIHPRRAPRASRCSPRACAPRACPRGGLGGLRSSLPPARRRRAYLRRGRDSNPRSAFDGRPLSKRVPSATRSPLLSGDKRSTAPAASAQAASPSREPRNQAFSVSSNSEKRRCQCFSAAAASWTGVSDGTNPCAAPG